LDFDRGAHRASFGKTVVQFDSWQDVLDSSSELSAMIANSETVIIDTAGTLLELIQSHLVDTQPMLAKNSIKLWGELKKVFTDYFTPLKRSGKNIVFIAHAKEKEEGDIRIKRPLVQGSSYDLLLQSCDLIGFYSMKNNRRFLTFDLSDQHVAKNCAGIEPIEITDLNFASQAMSHIIQKTKAALVDRIDEHKAAIDNVQKWQEFAKTCEPTVLYQALADAKFKKTEKTAIWAGVQKVMQTRGFKFDEEKKQFILND
jgi:hypothetical protein